MECGTGGVEYLNFGVQEVEWAAKRKVAQNTYEPVENACAECHHSVTQGWPDLPWPDAVAKSILSTTFREDVLHSDAVRRGDPGAFLLKEKVMTLLTTGKQVEREAYSYNEKGFVKRFGCTPLQAGLVPEEDADEFGQPWKGVVVFDEDEESKDKIKVKFFHRQVDQYVLTVFNPEQAVRRRQGRDHFDWLRQARLFNSMDDHTDKKLMNKCQDLSAATNTLASAQSPHGSSAAVATLGGDDVGEVIRAQPTQGAAVAAAGRAAAVRIASAPPVTATAAESAQKRSKRHTPASSAAHAGPKRRRVPQGGAAALASFAVIASSSHAEAVEGPDMHGAAGLTGDAEVDAHLKKLNVEQALAGTISRLGNLLGPATTCANTATENLLRRQAGHQLQARLKVIACAASLQAAKIPALEDKELKHYLLTLLQHGFTKFPAATSLAILRRHGLTLGAQELVIAMWPWALSPAPAQADSSFDALNPRLASLPGDDGCKASAFMQCVVVDRAVNLMSDMEKAIGQSDGDGSSPARDAATSALKELAVALQRTLNDPASTRVTPSPSQLLKETVEQASGWITTVAAIAGVMQIDVKQTIANARSLQCELRSLPKQATPESLLKLQFSAPGWSALVNDFYTSALRESSAGHQMKGYLEFLETWQHGPAPTRVQGVVEEMASALQSWKSDTRAAWRQPLEEGMVKCILDHCNRLLKQAPMEDDLRDFKEGVESLFALRRLHAGGMCKSLDLAQAEHVVHQMEERLELCIARAAVARAEHSVDALIAGVEQKTLVNEQASEHLDVLRSSAGPKASGNAHKVRLLIGSLVQQIMFQLKGHGVKEGNIYVGATAVVPHESAGVQDHDKKEGEESELAMEDAENVEGAEADAVDDKKEDKDREDSEGEDARPCGGEEALGATTGAVKGATRGAVKGNGEEADATAVDAQGGEGTADVAAQFPRGPTLLLLAKACQALLPDNDGGADALEIVAAAQTSCTLLCEIRVTMTTKGPQHAAKVKDAMKKLAASVATLTEERIARFKDEAMRYLGAPSSSHAEDMQALVRATRSNADVASRCYHHTLVAKLSQAAMSARDELAVIAGGGPEGCSWKDGLPENASWSAMQAKFEVLFKQVESKGFVQGIGKLTRAMVAYKKGAQQARVRIEDMDIVLQPAQDTVALARATLIEDARATKRRDASALMSSSQTHPQIIAQVTTQETALRIANFAQQPPSQQ